MEELTIEEKAARYDEAIRKAKEVLDSLDNNYICNHLTKDDIREMYANFFPELIEKSEDERIRKAIIDFFLKQFDYASEEGTKERLKSWIAWLEKQGEQKPADKVTEEEEAIKENIHTLGEEDERIYKSIIYSFAHYYPLTVKQQEFVKSLITQNTWKPSDDQITWLYRAADDASKDSRMKQVLNELLSDLKKLRGSQRNDREIPNSEQKSADKVEPKFKVGDIIYRPSNSSCPVHSSIDDTPYTVIEVLDEHYILGTNKGKIQESFVWQDYYELVRQNPIWSKEDEYILETLFIRLNNEQDNYPQQSCDFQEIQEIKEWLKSLKDRVQPQPQQ